jgi:cation transporter-like permease
MDKKIKVRKSLVPTQKEKNLFFTAAAVGLCAGLFGNLLASVVYEALNVKEHPVIWLIIFAVIFFGITISFYKKIKPVYYMG